MWEVCKYMWEVLRCAGGIMRLYEVEVSGVGGIMWEVCGMYEVGGM